MTTSTIENGLLKRNVIYNENCLTGLKKLPSECIDMVLTSPPYDNLRTYNGYSFDFENIAKELYRVVKTGAVIVWIVNDATIKGSETGTSFRQALYFKKVGFNLHDTMIFRKKNPVPTNCINRYQASFCFYIDTVIFFIVKIHLNISLCATIILSY